MTVTPLPEHIQHKAHSLLVHVLDCLIGHSLAAILSLALWTLPSILSPPAGRRTDSASFSGSIVVELSTTSAEDQVRDDQDVTSTPAPQLQRLAKGVVASRDPIQAPDVRVDSPPLLQQREGCDVRALDDPAGTAGGSPSPLLQPTAADLVDPGVCDSGPGPMDVPPLRRGGFPPAGAIPLGGGGGQPSWNRPPTRPTHHFPTEEAEEEVADSLEQLPLATTQPGGSLPGSFPPLGSPPCPAPRWQELDAQSPGPAARQVAGVAQAVGRGVGGLVQLQPLAGPGGSEQRAAQVQMAAEGARQQVRLTPRSQCRSLL